MNWVFSQKVHSAKRVYVNTFNIFMSSALLSPKPKQYLPLANKEDMLKVLEGRKCLKESLPHLVVQPHCSCPPPFSIRRLAPPPGSGAQKINPANQASQAKGGTKMYLRAFHAPRIASHSEFPKFLDGTRLPNPKKRPTTRS
jgi:hypothetical protein